MPSKTKRYARVSWCAEDIRTLRPKWSVKQCNEFLENNERYLQSFMIENGWSAIELMLPCEEAIDAND
jgi:hypothetical protein